jgi:two-component system, chemotaxis family, response regulator Rcp1
MALPIQILLVEDNPGDAELAKETFESYRLRVEVTIVDDGAKALAYMQRPRAPGHAWPDLIVLDLNIPKLDGRAVLAELKRGVASRIVPVVVLTSSDAPKDIEDSYRLGANCYVIKPLGIEAFQRTLWDLENFWFATARLP